MEIQKKFKRNILVLLILSLVFIFVGCGSEDAAEAVYNAGTYSATKKGMNGDVVVSVTVNENKIEEVVVVEHSETAGISDPAIEKLPQDIVEAQSVEVDSVTGATMTSKAIKEAVTDALSQASIK